MKWSIILLISLLILPFAGADGFNQTFVNGYIDKVVNKINNKQRYIDFINQSEYRTAKVTIEKMDYYFTFNGSKVSRVDKRDYDAMVKISYKDFKEGAELQKQGNKFKLKYLAIKVIPLKLQWKLLKQCLRTEWCRREVV